MTGKQESISNMQGKEGKVSRSSSFSRLSSQDTLLTARTASQSKRSQRSPQGRRQEAPDPCRGIVGRTPPPSPRIQQEINQQTTGQLIPRGPLGKAVKECLQGHGDYNLTKVAFDVIREAAEIYLTHFFEDAFRSTTFRGSDTLESLDMEMVRLIRGYSDPTA